MMGRYGCTRRTLPIGSRRSRVHVRRRFKPFSVYCARFEQSPAFSLATSMRLSLAIRWENHRPVSGKLVMPYPTRPPDTGC